MKLTKKQREDVRAMFAGRCAYCGCELNARWHADHLQPVVRDIIVKHRRLTSSPTECRYPERHAISNMMPSCAPCNISKHSFDLETWRRWLAGHINSLNAYQPIYRRARAFGLVVETDAPVVFHFERLLAQAATIPTEGS